MGGVAHVADEATAGAFEEPASGEEEDSEHDEAEGAVEFTHDAGEVEPHDGEGEGDHSVVDEGFGCDVDAPCDEEDGGCGDEGVGEDVGFGVGVGSAAEYVGDCGLGPGKNPCEGGDDQDGKCALFVS